MRVEGALRLAMMAVAVLWQTQDAAGRTSAIKLCGPRLSETMSKICRTYNGPSDVSAEQPARTSRRKRDMGIVEECCYNTCTWAQLNQYCADGTASSESLDQHTIADRSAEGSVGSASEGVARASSVASVSLSSPAVVVAGTRAGVRAGARAVARGEVGRAWTSGYGGARARARTRARRCWCRRKRRSGRRRYILMGNTRVVTSAGRAAPVVGTVSPLLAWGRTMHAELWPRDRDRLAYVTV